MPQDDGRNIQEERQQEAIIRTPDIPTQDAQARRSTPIVTTPNASAASGPSTNLSLPNRGHGTATSQSAVFAKDIDLPRNVIQSTGDTFTIDVVPDTRSAVYVFTEYVQRTYSKLDFESHSMVSPASLVGYLTYMVHAYVFLTDLFCMQNLSAYAEEVDASHTFRKIIDTFSNAPVPDIVFDILNGLTPHRMDTKSNIEFLSNYGSALFEYDAPRLISPLIFLLAHNQLVAQTKTSNAYKTWLTQTVLTYNSKAIKVGNLIGGIYQTTGGNTTNTYLYRNWFFRAISRLADSATHRTHLRRPDILDFDISPPSFDDDTYNPYVHLLMLTPPERMVTMNFLTSLSKFSQSQLGATRTLKQFIDIRSGSIPRTLIIGPTAPTWNHNDLMDIEEDTRLSTGSFQNFCLSVGFCKPPPTNTAQIPVPYPEDPSLIKSDFYLVSSDDRKTKLRSIDPEEELHLEGMVLLFDPYDDEPSAHYSTVISGKLIENDNVDGMAFTLPNPSDALVRTNSRLLHGAISLKHIKPQFSGVDFILYPRIPRTSKGQSSLAILWNSSQIWLPMLNRAITAFPSLSPFASNLGVDGTHPATNIVTMKDHRKPNRFEEQVNLWSSFRYRHTSERPSTSTVMYFSTLELLFGTRSSMMQTYSIQQLLPLH